MPDMKVIMKMVKNMESELSNGQTSQITLESFTITTSMEKVYTPGLIVENTKENGVITKCMEKELSYGPMVESILVNIRMIKRKVTVSSSGLMAGAIEENGAMANSMVKEPILLVQDKKNTVNGVKVKESNGLAGVSNKNNEMNLCNLYIKHNVNLIIIYHIP